MLKMFAFLYFLTLFLFDSILASYSVPKFPLEDQPQSVQEGVQKQLSNLVPKENFLPQDLNMIPFIDCVARSTGHPHPNVDQVLNRLESYTRKGFVEEMFKCIGSSRSGFHADRIMRGDGRIETFFIRTRYVLWAWLRMLKRQEKGSRPKSGLNRLAQVVASPVVATRSQIEQVSSRLNKRTSGNIGLDPCEYGSPSCPLDDTDASATGLDGLGGVVIGALEEIGRGVLRITSGLRRFNGELKRFVNSGTDFLIG